jgi:hypothetical protein
MGNIAAAEENRISPGSVSIDAGREPAAGFINRDLA